MDNTDAHTNVPNDLFAGFRNCIIWGNLDDEVGVNIKGTGAFQTLFSRNIIKAKDVIFDTSMNLINQNPRFVNIYLEKYQLDDRSPAIDAGVPQPPYALPDDIDDQLRDSKPDLGCY
jgi:hypothetical protein